ncbi:RT0821/Lpp0805 family surface protein [Aquibium microcysteis]|uniref:RT0821/Lpp0805 family surface protein n=1 Tax=Aquibium microcysteis TaxID=675281 RepID=UPI00165D09BB|nr:RT0821/Lpp0805 family surface protein [Aquibium microcysteis]
MFPEKNEKMPQFERAVFSCFENHLLTVPVQTSEVRIHSTGVCRVTRSHRKDSQDVRGPWAGGTARASVLALVLIASGCTSRAPSLDSLGFDQIKTGSISGGRAVAPDAERMSDETTIRNAVSSANLDEAPGAPLAWANSQTGSRGEIFGVTQYMDETRLCRRFRVSRESFQGVSLFRGEVCMSMAGEWWVRTFEAA